MAEMASRRKLWWKPKEESPPAYDYDEEVDEEIQRDVDCKNLVVTNYSNDRPSLTTYSRKQSSLMQQNPYYQAAKDVLENALTIGVDEIALDGGGKRYITSKKCPNCPYGEWLDQRNTYDKCEKCRNTPQTYAGVAEQAASDAARITGHKVKNMISSKKGKWKH